MKHIEQLVALPTPQHPQGPQDSLRDYGPDEEVDAAAELSVPQDLSKDYGPTESSANRYNGTSCKVVAHMGLLCVYYKHKDRACIYDFTCYIPETWQRYKAGEQLL